MKKNISINISGIIFHIEEDGYENLRRYLDSIHKYFSTFEDSTEIMADIESRIAEIFLSKLNEGKQVITSEDVNALIATMGSVSDFKAAEEAEASADDTRTEVPPGSNYGEQQQAYTPPRSLMRDQKRKILGGVCSGLGNYLNIDPLWIRLLFAAFAFAWGITIIVYIVMWIVVPGSYDLSEPETTKKMFRDPESKVLGGVSGGVASYLHIDILAVRIIFVLLAFAGFFGVFLYIILWVILPEARTLTDRMQMQGEPVTLSNIESSLKKNQETQGAASEESDLTKILLFPFRLIGTLLQALARVIGPLAEAVRVLVGLFIVGTGLTFLISLLVAGGISLGLFSATIVDVPWGRNYNEMTFPVDAFMRAFPGWTVIAGFLAMLIPTLVIILLGISVIARRMVFNAAVGWSMFAIFLVCVGLLSVGIPKIVFAFNQSAEHIVETKYSPTGKTAVLKIHEVGLDNYDATSLVLRGHSDKQFKLVQNFKAQGTTKAQAIENAQMVDYNVSVEDSVFTFDSNVRFKPDAIFRAQELDMVLYIPYNYPFILDRSSSDFIDQYVDYNYRDGYTWQITEDGMECIDCPKPTEEELAWEDLRDFDQLDIHGIFDVRIHRGDAFSVELKGPESEKKKYNIYRTGKTLVIDFEGKKRFDWNWKKEKVLNDKVYISVTMPDVGEIKATGFGSIDFDEFTGDEIEFSLRGPIKVKGKLNADHVRIDLAAKSELELEGRAQRMSADLEFASHLNTYDFEVQDAVIELRGASTAKVNVARTLEIEEGMASDIDYRGNPEVIRRR
jgi:phage shock protein PspC (stress-responsive transcriptional regulator)